MLKIKPIRIDSSSFFDFASNIGQGAIELISNIIAMVLVERIIGPEALGEFAFILSLYFFAGYFAEAGIPDFLEQQIALHPKRQVELTIQAKTAIRLSGFFISVLFILLMFKGSSITRIQDTFLIYLIIAISIPVRNKNQLKLALLRGLGMHAKIAGFKIKKKIWYILILFAMLFFIRFRTFSDILPGNLFFLYSFLALPLFFTELIYGLMLWRIIKLPSIFRTGFKLRQSYEIVKKSKDFVFSTDKFDLILYIDFLILGMFVSAEELGIYSQAALAGRIFLLIPLSIRPVIKNIFCNAVSQKNDKKLMISGNLFPATVFYINGVLCLYFLIFFEKMLGIFFVNPPGGAAQIFEIFIILLPGLLYLGSALAKDPFYEAMENQQALQHIIIIVFLVNLILNFYLVPFAGNKGSATATMISFLLYFILSETGLKTVSTQSVGSWFMAGIFLCFLYILSGFTNNLPVLTFIFIPLVFYICLLLSGFFDYNQIKYSNE